jgi:hypothetical protein
MNSLPGWCVMRSTTFAGLMTSVLLTAWGCGGGGTTPVTPSPPAPPTANSISITSGVDALRVGFFADFTVTASMSDLTTQIVTTQSVWTTSDPAIATIDAQGRLTGLSHGSVALNASYQGRTVSRSVHIVHNYGGHWDGTFAVRACDQSGIFTSSRYCENLGREPLSFALELTQSGANADQITGLMSLRNLVGPVSGSVTTDGRLVLSGPYVATTGGVNIRVEIPSWLTAPVGTVGMSGFFVYTLELVGADGKATQTNEIVTAQKKLEG